MPKKPTNTLTDMTPRDTLNTSRYVLRMLQELTEVDELGDEARLGMFFTLDWVCNGLQHAEQQLGREQPRAK